MDPNSILYLLAGLGAINGFIFGAYLLVTRIGKKNANVFLGIYLILISVRIFRSVHFYYSGLDTTVYYIGHAAFFLSLPFIYFYYRAIFNNQFQLSKKDLIHMVPISTLFIKSFTYINLIGFLLFLVYLILSHRELIHFKRKVNFSSQALKNYRFFWHRNLLIILYASVVFCSINLVFKIIPYITGALSYSFLLYLMLFYWNRYLQYQKNEKLLNKYTNSRISSSEAQTHIHHLLQKIETDKLFSDSTLTLGKLADLLSIPYYQLSQIINQYLGKNFSEFINEYRVREAKRLLVDPAYLRESVENIGYDAGFSNPSSFFYSFKKVTNTTPAQYRKKALLLPD